MKTLKTRQLLIVFFVENALKLNKKIKTYVFDDGTVMSPQEIVEKSKESYGKAMCMDCVFEQNVETESEDVEEEENTEE